MSNDPWFDDDPDWDYEPPYGMQCKRCKAEGLEWRWEPRDKKWVLIEPTGERHRCTAFNETFNDFEVLK